MQTRPQILQCSSPSTAKAGLGKAEWFGGCGTLPLYTNKQTNIHTLATEAHAYGATDTTTERCGNQGACLDSHQKSLFRGRPLCSPPRTRHLSLPFSGLALFLVLTLHSNQAHTLPFVTTAEQESPPKWNPRSPSPLLLLPLLPPPNQRYPRQPQEHPRPLPDQPHQHQHQHQHRRHQDQEHQERMGAMEPPPRPHPHWDLSHPPSHQPSLLLTRRFHQEASTGSWANMSRSSPSRTRSLRARSTPSMFS